MSMMIINDSPQKIDADPDMPLLWALRDLLDLRGTKFGCGEGFCGACTVHLNGKAVRSCQIPVSAAIGQRITTIEGLSLDLSHPVQQAWKELNVPQCGYCQAGQMMSAAALLEGNPHPDRVAIDQHMRGNLCRCGTYNRIRDAVARAAEIMRENGNV